MNDDENIDNDDGAGGGPIQVEQQQQQQQQQQQHYSHSNQSKNHNHRNRSHPPMSPLSIIGKHTVDTKLPPFHDASPYVCSYELTIIDCLTALMKAKQYQFFDWELSSSSNGNQYNNNNNNNNGDAKFDIHEYEYFEQVENGDLNWIIQGRILAFAGPSYTKKISPEGYCTLSTQDYIPYFQRKKVGLVVRLNQKNYEEDDFTSATPPIQHFEQYYTDGSVPTMAILQRILTAFETQCPQDQAFAVHCKAGLGRTGSCIGAWLMKHYRMTAKEVIGWMRICRPGMVIGPQQHFLQHIQPIMWQEGDMVRSLYPRNRLDNFAMMTVDQTMTIDTNTNATTTTPMVLGTTTTNASGTASATSSAVVVVTPPRGSSSSHATTNASSSNASSNASHQFQLRTPAEAMMLLSSSVDTITYSKEEDDHHHECGGHEVLLSGGGGCCGEELLMRMGGDHGADPGQADRLLAARGKQTQHRNQYQYHSSLSQSTSSSPSLCSSPLSVSTTNNNNESSSSDNNNNCSNSDSNNNNNNNEPMMTQSLPVTPDNNNNNNNDNDNPSTTNKSSSSSSPSLWARAFA